MNTVITLELLNKAMSSRGGWSKEQFELMGVQWPPVHGWKNIVIGKSIDREKSAKLVEIRDAHLKSKQWKRRNQYELVELIGSFDATDQRYQPLQRVTLST